MLVPEASAFESQTNACTGCHTLSTALSISATGPATVTPGQSFNAAITWSGGNSGTVVKWPSVNDNVAFGLNPSVVVSSGASGTAISALTAPLTEGNYEVAVYVAQKSSRITNFAIIPIEVKAPVTDNTPPVITVPADVSV
ncbi:MAG: hypothetical protein KAH86_04030, partial [Methanosarcinales archaeon]|nr:hypothetical protein [Methanosarcinales archaeon]